MLVISWVQKCLWRPAYVLPGFLLLCLLCPKPHSYHLKKSEILYLTFNGSRGGHPCLCACVHLWRQLKSASCADALSNFPLLFSLCSTWFLFLAKKKVLMWQTALPSPPRLMEVLYNVKMSPPLSKQDTRFSPPPILQHFRDCWSGYYSFYVNEPKYSWCPWQYEMSLNF